MFPPAQLVNKSNKDKIDNVFIIIEIIKKSGFCLAQISQKKEKFIFIEIKLFKD
jgi:hypothetical protein